MTFPEWAGLWGPAFPIFLVMVYFLNKLVNQVVPKGFRDLRVAITSSDIKAENRHKEFMDGMRDLAKEMRKVKKRCGECGKPQRSNKTAPTKR